MRQLTEAEIEKLESMREPPQQLEARRLMFTLSILMEQEPGLEGMFEVRS